MSVEPFPISLEELRDQAAFQLADGAPITLTQLRMRLIERYFICAPRIVYLEGSLHLRMALTNDSRFLIEGKKIRLVLSSY